MKVEVLYNEVDFDMFKKSFAEFRTINGRCGRYETVKKVPLILKPFISTSSETISVEVKIRRNFICSQVFHNTSVCSLTVTTRYTCDDENRLKITGFFQFQSTNPLLLPILRPIVKREFKTERDKEIQKYRNTKNGPCVTQK